MRLVNTILKIQSLCLLLIVIGCQHPSRRIYLQELQLDSLRDSTLSEESLTRYITNHSLFRELRRQDTFGYELAFAPVFIRGIPGCLFLMYSNHLRSDSIPKISFSW